MHKRITSLILLCFILMPITAPAIISLELTKGVAGAQPISVVPFVVQGTAPSKDPSLIIANDLQNSGRFKVYGKTLLTQFPSSVQEVSGDYFRRLGTDNVVLGKVLPAKEGGYQVSFQLVDVLNGKVSTILNQKYTIKENELRALSHHISDLIFQKITGIRGIFSTKLAYITIERPKGLPPRYTLEVSDQDGFNPRPLLQSSEPIMSPAWSPRGRQIAYVSFENHHAGIYVQDISTGARRLVSEFPGINGAPAWSPDGRKLAIVLSRSGAPNIYVMDIATGGLKQLTHDFYINTEPSWSPDGKTLLFTSNRSGGPQIYRLTLSNGSVSRLTYDGDYNARAAFTRDGNAIAMIHRVSGIYNIGILDLNTGRMQVLTHSAADSISPSIAPNGTMVLYDTVASNRNVLGMVSLDAKVQLALPARNGDAQDPAWSPFIS